MKVCIFISKLSRTLRTEISSYLKKMKLNVHERKRTRPFSIPQTTFFFYLNTNKNQGKYIYIRKVTRLAFLVCSLGKLSEGQLHHLANRCCKLFLKPLTSILQRCWQRADCSKRASALETLYVGQLQLSTQLIKPNHLVIFLPTQHHRSFLKLTIVLFIGCLLKLICSNSFANVLLITSCQASRKC